MGKRRKLLSECEAAATIGASPTLLCWFTSHAPESGDLRELGVAKEENGVVFFDEQELLSLNDWLRLPWRQPGKRPNILTGRGHFIEALLLGNASSFELVPCDDGRDSAAFVANKANLFAADSGSQTAVAIYTAFSYG